MVPIDWICRTGSLAGEVEGGCCWELAKWIESSASFVDLTLSGTCTARMQTQSHLHVTAPVMRQAHRSTTCEVAYAPNFRGSADTMICSPKFCSVLDTTKGLEM